MKNNIDNNGRKHGKDIRNTAIITNIRKIGKWEEEKAKLNKMHSREREKEG